LPQTDRLRRWRDSGVGLGRTLEHKNGMPVEALIPTSFLEALGGLLAIVAVICLLLSINDSWRGHAMRVFALLIILAVALISHHWSTYFAAMFIVATAATELEFLQNLAAIIRGNKDYFDYKSKLVSTKLLDKGSHDRGGNDA